MEDVFEMRQKAIEDKTLIWVDAAHRDEGCDSSNYTVSLVEPLRNVVGIRVIEATIPATMMSIDSHNCHVVIHTLGHSDELPVHPKHVLISHTAGPLGEAWRKHDATEKTLYYDPDHDSEHYSVFTTVNVYRSDDADGVSVDISDPETAVLCVFSGDATSVLGPHASYDTTTQTTIVTCTFGANMEYVTSVDIVAGVYCLPHGKYDSLRDFVAELSHLYSETKVGVMLDFVAPMNGKPERSFRLQVDPTKIWTHVNTSSAGFEHEYMTAPRHWCALWTGSTALSALGMHTNSVGVVTAGGEFITSDPRARYENRIRADTLVNLTGERYVWLRCPEVEQHMCTGVGKVLQKGIGVFRLEVPGVLNQDRTEFISVIPNQFHPIAKVSKLSFRFDMGSRENVPYNFRSINHFMLLSVSTLRPDKAVVYDHLPRLMNPEYEPNVEQWHIQEHDRRGDSSEPDNLRPEDIRRVVSIHNSALAKNSSNR